MRSVLRDARRSMWCRVARVRSILLDNTGLRKIIKWDETESTMVVTAGLVIGGEIRNNHLDMNAETN